MMSDMWMRPPQESQGSADVLDAPDDAQQEAYALMSMALDGLLDARETERLEVLMKDDLRLRATWQQWQKMDILLTSVVRAEPEPGFAVRFERRLALREQRQRARRRTLIGAAAISGWLLTIGVLALLGTFLVANQSQWMNGFVRELVYYPAAVLIWVRALRSSLSATIGAPQSIAVAVCYMMGAAVMLSTWLWFLRRTTREETAS